jgi:3-phenylpropionate/trans-cinnamate dioxygenase ferredoxin reductase subunit
VPGHKDTVRVEHHEHAAAQGRTVARNIADVRVDHADVPYFWTDLGDWATLEYVGLSSTWDVEQVEGSFEQDTFSVRYELEGRLVGVLTSGTPETLAEARKELGPVELPTSKS